MRDCREMKTNIIWVVLLACGIAHANKPGVFDVQKVRNDLYLQSPKVIEASLGQPFQKQVFHNDAAYDWSKRMIWFYYTPDSSEVVAFVFDYVHSKKGIRKFLRKKVQVGDYHLINVIYTPAYLHNHVMRFAGR